MYPQDVSINCWHKTLFIFTLVAVSMRLSEKHLKHSFTASVIMALVRWLHFIKPLTSGFFLMHTWCWSICTKITMFFCSHRSWIKNLNTKMFKGHSANYILKNMYRFTVKLSSFWQNQLHQRSDQWVWEQLQNSCTAHPANKEPFLNQLARVIQVHNWYRSTSTCFHVYSCEYTCSVITSF